MKVAKTSEELTKELLESTLRRLMARTTEEAKKAIMRIH